MAEQRRDGDINKICIIGAGSFGTAIAMLLATKGLSVKIWAREDEIVEGINRDHINPSYLSDIQLPESVIAFHSIQKALIESQMVVFATPSHALRDVANRVKSSLKGDEIIVSVAKGIEKDTLMTPSQILADVLEGALLEDQIGVLTGPSHAEEVGKFKPTTVVASAYAKRVSCIIQETFMTPAFRVYLNHDILGAEIGGALKNIMAIAAGIVDGAGLGDNAKAALMTRGLHEMKRMGSSLGASQDTFSGLTGMGDLIVTCMSEHSRNRYVGYNIGKGASLDEIRSGMSMIAEGVKTARSVSQWSERNNVEMPITDAVCRVLFEGLNPKDAVDQLMTRNAKDEIMI
jgi:glycerol-3-phosphate dehydrogenase (NAD(P)+)